MSVINNLSPVYSGMAINRILGEAIGFGNSVERLKPKKRYLQIAFNSDLYQVSSILPTIKYDERVIIEAGTPFLKREGIFDGIKRIASIWDGKIVADLKTVDGAIEEVQMAGTAGATAATVLGSASKETLDLFIETCENLGMDSMIDMLGVENPLRILMQLKKPPTVVVLHKGRDEESTKGKVIKYKHINRIRSKFDVLISAAGGVDLKESRSAIFNGADIVVVNIVNPNDPWTGINSNEDVAVIAQKFLHTIK